MRMSDFVCTWDQREKEWREEQLAKGLCPTPYDHQVCRAAEEIMDEDDPAPDWPKTDKCFWCGKKCDGNCLRVNHETGPRQMTPDDPAYWMLSSGKTTSTTVSDPSCYICRDPEFAQMGLPLCKPCPDCTAKESRDAGHVPADDEECTVCGFNLRVYYECGKDMDAYRKLTQED
ncbi:gp75 [Mycobacterium phage Spud]|uniref:Uncharacterized protein n=5 Tax=Bixzunavirus TaxID=680114 RepID=B5LKI5_9CAUD|nr:gp75 [Mycobacterium phage Spud]ACH62532.1 hypothetical protein SPUD_75 [Mycobacterium phage Spud]AER25443.1 hypothetical protein WALLY_74 [Mycobacterium phage Wally]AVJ48589.1 hypothetical protein SEA_PIER_80 [Mycobacterium phage Pier]